MESFEELLLRLAEHGNDFIPQLLIVILMIMRLRMLIFSIVVIPFSDGLHNTFSHPWNRMFFRQSSHWNTL